MNYDQILDMNTPQAPVILIIDDSVHLTSFLRDVLTREGYTVHTAVDGDNGLLLYRIQKPDLTLLGIHVRHNLGWNILERLQKQAHQSDIVILASSHSQEAKERALGAGCLAFIPKDLRLETFMHEVKEIVEKSLPIENRPTKRSNGRVLVVDDDQQIATMLQRFLSFKGFEVSTASNGQEALASVKRIRPHLVLLDLQMPGMSGLEVLRALRKFDKEVAVMMITGNIDTNLAEQTIKEGACDYIVKPLNIHYLETTVMAKVVMVSS